MRSLLALVGFFAFMAAVATGLQAVIVVQDSGGGGGAEDYSLRSTCQFVAFVDDSDYSTGTTADSNEVSGDCDGTQTYTLTEVNTAVNGTSQPISSPSGHRAVAFDATDHYDVLSADADDFDGVVPYSLGCWLMITDDTLTFRRWWRSEATNGHSFETRGAGVDLEYYVTSGGGVLGVSLNDATQDVWAHHVVTIDASGNSCIYKDGEIDVASCPSGTGIGDISGSGDIELGSTVAAEMYECFYMTEELTATEVCEICRTGFHGGTTDRGATCGSCTLP